MFSDEKLLLEIRFNILNKFVDKFVITEAKYLHNGDEKKLNFNINEFKEFKSKIEYVVVDSQPQGIEILNSHDSLNILNKKKILNSLKRDNFQREMLLKGLENTDKEDIIMISDVDEIPDLNKFDLNRLNDDIAIFKQKMFYYKFNLYYENFIWFGTKATKKRNFVSPQWLRNIKNKKYAFWRFDTLISKKKYRNIHFVENGGWHFTCIKNPREVHKKLLSYAHHQDYEDSKLTLTDLENRMKDQEILYDHSKDKKNQNKWSTNKKLKITETNQLPGYLEKNKDKYIEWFAD